jgi:hypothetical protein
VKRLYLILDQVGLGRLEYVTADGLIIKRPAHPRALELARRASATLPDLEVGERYGEAYTDASVATKRGLVALTLVAVPKPGSSQVIRWHQMSDTLQHIDPHTLQDTIRFTWQILQEVDLAE